MRIFLSCFEASGDAMAGVLVEKLRRQYGADAEIFGITGPSLQAAGVESWLDITELNVMGIVQVLKEAPRLLRLIKQLAQRLDENPPDIILCVDAPDFHIRLMEKVRRRPKFAAQWVSPSVWAWRAGRAKRFAKAFDAIYCIFPFEPACYENLPIEAVYVGNPSQDKARLEVDTEAIFQAHFADDRPSFCLLPGSRHSELQRLKDDFIAIKQLVEADIDVQWLIPSYPKFSDWLESWWAHDDNPPKIITDPELRYVAMRQADAAMCCMGTAELELSLRHTPHIALYRFKALDNLLLKLLTFNINNGALSNILLKKEAIPEYIHHAIDHQAIADTLCAFLQDGAVRQAQKEAMKEINAMLSPPEGYTHFTEALLAHLERSYGKRIDA